MWAVMSHYHVVLFGTLLFRDDFHVADCTVEALAKQYVVYLGWVAIGAVCDPDIAKSTGPWTSTSKNRRGLMKTLIVAALLSSKIIVASPSIENPMKKNNSGPVKLLEDL